VCAFFSDCRPHHNSHHTHHHHQQQQQQQKRHQQDTEQRVAVTQPRSKKELWSPGQELEHFNNQLDRGGAGLYAVCVFFIVISTQDTLDLAGRFCKEQGVFK